MSCAWSSTSAGRITWKACLQPSLCDSTTRRGSSARRSIKSSTSVGDVRVRACVRACVRVYVCLCVCVYVCAYVFVTLIPLEL